MIAIRGVFKAFRFVRHPIFEEKVCRELAMSYVRPVSRETQELMNQQRLQLSLSLDEDYPLEETNHAMMAETIEAMKDL